ncbi:MAG: SAM-dependent methyltransferase [Lachnospiraceae bacterium]|nr:SAM-dependent methyltransferase [Lachnospiraceae bacterium]
MQLSKRMALLASKVTEGNRLADVGTDHGYIPIALVQEKKIPSAIAMDVNQGPLKRAKEHIQDYGLDTYIETRLSDGLAKLDAGEADTVLIAGMGGPLTVRILREGTHCLDSVQELILQPQSDLYMVREYLCSHGFCIVEEDIVLDEGKYYPMMKVVHATADPMSESELSYGKLHLQQSPDIWKSYLHEEKRKTEQILYTLEQAGKESSERAEELRKKLRMLKEIS